MCNIISSSIPYSVFHYQGLQAKKDKSEIHQEIMRKMEIQDLREQGEQFSKTL